MSSRLSKEEIARLYTLPERKSKIATLLKQDGQAYCICRSSDSSRFMIGCDSCEEWYHGDCIGLTEREAKYIRQFFCIRCNEEDPSLETVFRPGVKPELEARFCPIAYRRRREKLADITQGAVLKQQSDHQQQLHHHHHHQQQHHYQQQNHQLQHHYQQQQQPNLDHLHQNHYYHQQQRPDPNHYSRRSCGQCTNCFRVRDCGECSVCRNFHHKEICLNRICYKLQNQIYQLDKKEEKRAKEEKKKSQLKPGKTKSSSGRRKRKDSDSDYDKSADTLRQCYGPQCINAARPKSKYCSDRCGLQLATTRIYQVLPQRIQEWALSPCISEEINRRELESVRRQQFEVQHILQELNKRHVELDAIINRAKSATIDYDAVDDTDEDEMSMYCITCGHEIHSRTAIKHMEKCFNKYESQASFGSIYKTRIEGNNMFCDFYNLSNKTYCKRLRVLCPEHCKDPKISDHEVCGCPLVTNVFNLTGEFCRSSKKSCIKHYCWQKLRRAEIDMERVRQWLKLDELIEQERQIRQKMSDRAGVLGLMLHSTYNHEIMEQLVRQAQAAEEGHVDDKDDEGLAINMNM